VRGCFIAKYPGLSSILSLRDIAEPQEWRTRPDLTYVSCLTGSWACLVNQYVEQPACVERCLSHLLRIDQR
jgi:hypothetical protein